MKISIALLFCLIIGGSLSAQEKYIDGIVTTFDSIVIIGADIKVKSSGQTVKTDTTGYFKVKVLLEDKLTVKAKGFISQKVKIEAPHKRVAVNLKLRPTEKAKEYAIGYGYVKDSEKLSAVCQLTNKNDDFSRYINMYDLIRGRFPGVQIQGQDIIIRGTNSLMLSSAALIIVDNISCGSGILETLSPSQVKSINIIKDGNAAIYGSRGANGVVIIETKNGEN